MADIHKYRVNESNNIQLGQAGSIFDNGAAGATTPSNGVIVAIQFIADSTFTALTPVDDSYIGTSGGAGDAVASGDTFGAGVTIFGRWSSFELNSGKAIAYLG
tara:strand:+ start:1827 stop:2135 length:309 start_codon:yes stop_codon:yes gene_type:complete